jgi:hypothetical protein
MTREAFQERDLAHLSARDIPIEEAEAQLSLLRTPPPAIVLDRPCTVGDGITQLQASEQDALSARGEAAAAAGRVMKFVPASGAATRMFHDLIAALGSDRRPSSSPAARTLFESIDRFAFGAELRKRSGVIGRPKNEEEERQVLRTLLGDLGCAELPKGLVPFHSGDRPRTAFEEHLLEATRYARGSDGTCRIHFTIAPGVRHRFEACLRELAPSIEAREGVKLLVSFSEQQPATDTIALDAEGRPFRTADGTLLFRPAGHGALIRNLQDLAGDIVVIKNIDNVVPDEASHEVVRWKRMLIGVLATVQTEVFDRLERCHASSGSSSTIDEALEFAAQQFARIAQGPLNTSEARRDFAIDALDRPLRICGVVPNHGEPGGAPFWVLDEDGGMSRQIVESSQVNATDARQINIFNSATHFNPVDLVCGLRNWEGKPFDLARFVDPARVFLSSKTHEGRQLRALERPGLWNGAMAGWNTIFVEVPAATFAPVKTVLDLLRPQHQPIERASST